MLTGWLVGNDYQCGLQNFLILLGNRETFDLIPDMEVDEVELVNFIRAFFQ